MDQADLTYREAWLYLCAAVIFVASILGWTLSYGGTQPQFRPWAGLLLLIPMSAAVVIMALARSVAVRLLPWRNDLPFIAVWGLAAIWLMWGLALPSAVRRLWRGR